MTDAAEKIRVREDAAELMKLADEIEAEVVTFSTEIATYLPGFVMTVAKRNMIVAALRLAALQGVVWRPIETAPKDGTGILVCDASLMNSQKIVFWDADADGSTFPWCVEDAGYYAYNAFTHWKPLDEQPQVGTSEQSAKRGVT